MSAARVSSGGHNIPTNDIKRRYPRSFQNLKTHLKRCDLAYIYDNSKNYKLIASYRNGIMHRQNDTPEFIRQYLSFLFLLSFLCPLLSDGQSVTVQARLHGHRGGLDYHYL